MNVLRSNIDYISSYVPVEEILDYLLDKNLISTNDYGKLWAQREEEYEGMADKNLRMFGCLLDTLAEYKDQHESVYTICKLIAEKYPTIGVNIPYIGMGIRVRRAIGQDKLVTLFDNSNSTAVDIRKMEVSTD